MTPQTLGLDITITYMHLQALADNTENGTRVKTLVKR